MKYHYPPGATPRDLNEAIGLIPKHIILQSELNEWEQINILEAEGWAFRRKHKDLLAVSFIQKLHKKCLIIHGNGRDNLEKRSRILS